MGKAGKRRARTPSRGQVDVHAPSTRRAADDGDPASDWETDEEQLVHVELSGVFQDDLARDPSLAAAFVGLDSPRPVVQIGGQVFEGAYSHAVGTSLFLTQSERDQDGGDGADGDPVFDRLPAKKVQVLCKTDKKLTLKRVFLKRRAQPTAAESAEKAPA